MNKPWLFGVALIAAWSLVCSLADTPALAQGKSKSLASRTTLCKADCRADAPHGIYKPYQTEDPTLMSVAARKLYADCVRICLAPLPPFYVQRPLLEAGGVWFGMTAATCLNCHVDGPNLRVPPEQLKASRKPRAAASAQQ